MTSSQAFENHTMEELMDALASLLPQVVLGAPSEALEEKIETTIHRSLNMMKIDVGLDAGLLAMNLVSFLVTFVGCVGFIRQIFLWKAVTLAVNCVVKMVPMISMQIDEGLDLTHFNRRHLDLLEAWELIFESYHQILTAFFHYELMNLICKLERQRCDTIRFLKTIGVSFLFVSGIVGLEYGMQAAL